MIEAVPRMPAGALWTKGEVGPAYSLLLRVPDVLDRANGVYLSQIIGVEAAAAVNARLLRGRPDGGRVRITPSGVVVSRRNADSPWFVVGSVAADGVGSPPHCSPPLKSRIKNAKLATASPGSLSSQPVAESEPRGSLSARPGSSHAFEVIRWEDGRTGGPGGS